MKPKSKPAMIVLCMLAGFWSPYIGAAMDVILPSISNTLQLSGNAYNGILLAGTLAAAICFLPIGNLSDRFGRKRLFFWGTVLMIISVIISGFAQSPRLLILGSILLSLGGAVLYVNAVALGCSFFAQKGSGKIIGIISASIYSGRMLGPALAGFITQFLSWRWVFWSSILVGIVLLLLLTKIEETLSEPWEAKFDWQGACIFSFGIVGLIYGFTRVSTNVYSIFYSIAGAILLFLFVLWEGKARKPILPLSLFHQNRHLTLSLVTIILSYTATYGVAALGSLYLQYTVKLSPSHTGMLIAILPLTQCLFSPLSGRLVDRYQPRKVATLGLCGAIIGLSFLLFVTPQSPIWIYITALAILGVSLAFIVTPNTQAVMASMPKQFLSLGSSLVGEVRNIGESLSIGIVNIILVTQIGYHLVSAGLVQELMATFHFVIICFLVVAFFAMVCSYLRGNNHKKQVFLQKF